jgi:hypothetical protein
VTAAVRREPPHGTDARYKGARTRPPCRCTPCTRAHRQADIKRELVRQRGGCNRVPIGEVLPHIQMLLDSGMSQTLIARQAGISQSLISYVITGRNKTVQTAKARRILAVQPRRFDGNAERPAVGSIRRVRALYSLGHGRAAISQGSGLSVASISLLAEGRWNVIDNRAATALAAVYEELGRQRGTSWKNERRARAEAWAPPGAWDDIDDPAAVPDWTGVCGTDRGYWVHKRQQLPTCARCEAAHVEWLAEHAHLAPQDLNRECFRARAAAASREADLATDARELMRFDVDLDRAAERLGVTKQHLQQALIRHPETETAAKAGLERAA